MFLWFLVFFGLGIASCVWFAKTQDRRTRPGGAADLLPWGFMVDSGVMLQKDGSFVAGWRYRGPDLSAATDFEVDALSQHVNDALLPFDDGWLFHVDAVRRPANRYAPPGFFPDPLTELFDRIRRKRFASATSQFETESFFVVTFLPAEEAYRKASDRFVRRHVDDGGDWRRFYREFCENVERLESRLSGRLEMTRLGSDELCSHLHRTWTGLGHPVLSPPHGSYLDYVLSDQHVVGGTEPQVGEMHVRVIALQGFPQESYGGILAELMEEPFEYRWSNRILPLSPARAAKEIRSRQLGWFQKRRAAGSFVAEVAQRNRKESTQANDHLFENSDAYSKAAEAKDALGENSSGDVRHCYFNSNLVVMAASSGECVRRAKRLVKLLNDRGFTARIETVNAFEAFLGSQPGNGYHNVRTPMVNTMNVADIVPFTSVWPGFETHPNPLYPVDSPALMWTETAGSTPFRMTPSSGDVGHTLVIGKTGSGKSTLMGSIVSQFQRYENSQCFVFDTGGSAWLLTAGAGGQHFNLAPGTGGLKFQPLRGVDDPEEAAWAAEWIGQLVTLQGLSLTAEHRHAIKDAIDLVGGMKKPSMRTLTTLHMQMQNAQLREAIKAYTANGPYGLMLDAEGDGMLDGSFQTFEMSKLLDAGDEISVAVLLYVFHRLEQRLDGRPTLVVVEEADRPFGNTIFAEQIRDALLRWRKRAGSVMLISQSLSLLDRLEDKMVIYDSCATKLLCPNADAVSEEQSRLYREIGLNDKEIAVIARSTPKRDYYFKNPAGSRLFQLALSPAELAFLGSRRGCSLGETQRLAEEAIRKFGERWPGRWLEDVGEVEAARDYDAILEGFRYEEEHDFEDGERFGSHDLVAAV